MGDLREVHVIGGGLAGLALGIELRRRSVPVVVHEAGALPAPSRVRRIHFRAAGCRYCSVRIGRGVASAPRHRTTVWFRGERRMFERELPEPAIAISRYALDAAMARRFVALGGDLRCGDRRSTPSDAEGWINAAGRARKSSHWLGLKAHFTGLPLRAGLEMHLGRGGYARPDPTRVWSCQRLRIAAAHGAAGTDKATLLASRLEAIGLRSLGGRLRAPRVIQPRSPG